MPSSLDTIMAWLPIAPTSTITAPAVTNSGVHDGSVTGATSTSPGSSSVASAGWSTTWATPVATPGQLGPPVQHLTDRDRTTSTAPAASTC